MICPKCNKQTAEGLDFCTSCGNSLKDTEVSTDKNKKTLKKSLIIALTVVAVIGALYFSGVIAPSSGSAEDAAIASVEAYLEFDYEQTLSLFPDRYVDWVSDKFYRGDRDGFEEMLRDKAESNRAAFDEKYGSALNYSEITVTKTREYSSNELDALNDEYDGMGLNVKVTAASLIRLKYTLTYLDHDDRQQEENVETNVFTVKIGGKWYVMDK